MDKTIYLNLFKVESGWLLKALVNGIPLIMEEEFPSEISVRNRMVSYLQGVFGNSDMTFIVAVRMLNTARMKGRSMYSYEEINGVTRVDIDGVVTTSKSKEAA